MEPQNAEFYTNGAKQMVAEGKEVASKIIAFMKQNEEKLKKMEPKERKAFVLAFEPSKSFNEVHPIVFHYLAVQGIFRPESFKRYVFATFGKPKDPHRLELARHDKKSMFHYKNEQSALYYKYLLMESNPEVDKNRIHKIYEDTVRVLNEDTDRMIDIYTEAEKKSKQNEEATIAEKREELVKLMHERLA